VTGVDATEVARRAAALRDRIAGAGGDPAGVRLIAVTKGFPVEVVRAALEAGLSDIGESYVQELVGKVAALQGDEARSRWPHWHLVGRLQRNKVRKAAPYVALWHSVDRLSLGAEIARFAPGAAVLVQVNVAAEEQKGGCSPAMVPAVVDGLRDLGLDVRGLMTVAPEGPPEVARSTFRTLRGLAHRLGVRELSMGMTGDLDVAVEEGATMVRVGTGLFGPRPMRAGARH
jgi:PLP dependent protein